MSDNVLICKICTERLESFDAFYSEIHKSQLKFEEQQASQQAMVEQKDEIRFIILLKDNKTEIQLKEIESSEGIENQFATMLDIPTETLQMPQQAEITEVTAGETKDDASVDDSDIEEQTSVETRLMSLNLESLPKELIVDGKLLIKGKELSKLIAKFYKLECNVCSVKKKFRKFSAMINHFKNEHSMKGFVSCCGLKIVKIRQIAMHMARHIQPEAFKCSLCNKMLTCPKILQYHMQNHLPEEERNLACPEEGCNRRFSYQSALVTHSISHLPEEQRTTFSCEHCGRKFKTAGRLTVHRNSVHSKNIVRKEFSCEICSKKFFCKSNLAYHLTTHKNFEFQVECEICNKWLKNKICLRKHMTIHSETRHFCDICEYSAVNKQCLMNHKKVQHSDSKPYSCEVCSKTFKLKNTLINHVNAQHNGLRKYSCEFCSKTFVSSGNCKLSNV